MYPPAHFEGRFKSEMFASLEEVRAAIGDDGVYIENALTQDWHDQEHIPGSSCLPLTNLTVDWVSYLPDEQLVARMNNAVYDRRIITYCGGGIAATLNAMAYLIAGYENVAVYDGSLFEWKGEGMPVASRDS